MPTCRKNLKGGAAGCWGTGSTPEVCRSSWRMEKGAHRRNFHKGYDVTSKQTNSAHQKWLWIGLVPYCNPTICITVTATICAQSWASFKCTESKIKKSQRMCSFSTICIYSSLKLVRSGRNVQYCKKKKCAEWTECVIMRIWTMQLSVCLA